MKVLDYIQHESDRQSATLLETIGMVHAWEYANQFRGTPNLDSIKHLAYLINRTNDYRIVPAVFAQGRPAIDASLIPRAMDQWHENMRLNGTEYVDMYIKEFLDIHPFADGNGRVASLLYNFLRGTLKTPTTMPYHYGENS